MLRCMRGRARANSVPELAGQPWSASALFKRTMQSWYGTVHNETLWRDGVPEQSLGNLAGASGDVIMEKVGQPN
jgi:hypothetical protein